MAGTLLEADAAAVARCLELCEARRAAAPRFAADVFRVVQEPLPSPEQCNDAHIAAHLALVQPKSEFVVNEKLRKSVEF
jgi:hypothetical protein